MSSKAANPYADSEYLRAAFIEREVLERDFDVVVTTAISLCCSPFCLRIRLEAIDCRSEEEGPPLAAYEATWPSASTMGFTPTLYQALVKLARLVSDSRQDAWNATLRAQKGARPLF